MTTGLKIFFFNFPKFYGLYGLYLINLVLRNFAFFPCLHHYTQVWEKTSRTFLLDKPFVWYISPGLFEQKINNDAIHLNICKSKKLGIITYYHLTKRILDFDKMTVTYSKAKNTNHWPITMFYSLLKVASMKSEYFFFITKKPPQLIRKPTFIFETLIFQFIEDYKKIISQQALFPKSITIKSVNNVHIESPSKRAKTT